MTIRKTSLLIAVAVGITTAAAAVAQAAGLFAHPSVSEARVGTLGPGDVAVVGQIHIGRRLLDSAVRVEHARLMDDGRGARRLRLGQGDLERLALRVLVQSAQQQEEAARRGIRTSSRMVTARINQIRRKYFHDSPSAYRQELRREGLTLADVREEVRAELLSQLLQDSLGGGARDKTQALAAWAERSWARYCAAGMIRLRAGYRFDVDPCSGG